LRTRPSACLRASGPYSAQSATAPVHPARAG
jgi:hypothetical protein